MSDRVTLITEVFMNLDGQPQVVRRGTVFDTVDGSRFLSSVAAVSHIVAAGGGGALINNGHTTVSKPPREKG